MAWMPLDWLRSDTPHEANSPVALSRAGQTFRASVTPSLREVGIWGMSALRLGKPAYFEGPSVSHEND
jgi:hypothetical protein